MTFVLVTLIVTAVGLAAIGVAIPLASAIKQRRRTYYIQQVLRPQMRRVWHLYSPEPKPQIMRTAA